jgi:hypothetical protein
MRKWLKIIGVVLFLVVLGACAGAADNSEINAAFVNSPVFQELVKLMNEDEAQLRELYRRGLISANQFNSYMAPIRSRRALIEGDGLMPSLQWIEWDAEFDDDGAEVSPGGAVLESGEKSSMIAAVIEAISWLYLPASNGSDGCFNISPSNGGDLQKPFDDWLGKYGATFFPLYGGYCLRCAVKSTITGRTTVRASSYVPSLELGPGSVCDVRVRMTREVPAGWRGKRWTAWEQPDFFVPLSEQLARLATVDVFILNSNMTIFELRAVGDLLRRWDRDNPSTHDITGFSGRGDWKFPEAIALHGQTFLEPDSIPVRDRIAGGGMQYAAVIQVTRLNLEPALALLRNVVFDETTGGVFRDTGSGNIRFYATEYNVATLQGFYATGEVSSRSFVPVFSYPVSALRSLVWEPSMTAAGVAEGQFNLCTGSVDYISRVSDNTPERLVLDIYTGLVRRFDGGVTVGNTFMDINSVDIARGGWRQLRYADTNVVSIAPSDAVVGDGLSFVNGTLHGSAARLPSTGTLNLSDRNAPLFVLTEYLEALYAPGVVAGENLVSFGRKVRLDPAVYSGNTLSISTPAAFIVGAAISDDVWNNRTNPGGPLALDVTDFACISGFYTPDGALRNNVALGETLTFAAALQSVAARRFLSGGNALNDGKPEATRGRDLPEIGISGMIMPVFRFGSRFIAKDSDASGTPASTQTPLYAIALFGSLYDRGLFGAWINAEGDANMEGWRATARQLGYTYNVNARTLNEFMRGNYAFELTQHGHLNLDLMTVIEINREIEQRQQSTAIQILRTTLFVLGLLMTVYVSVLLACWGIDVNMDFGLNLLQKVSLGHFVAVRSAEDMPPEDAESKVSYMTFRGIMIRSIAFAVMGVLLIVTDPVGLLVRLMEWLNFIISEIGRLIFGIDAL